MFGGAGQSLGTLYAKITADMSGLLQAEIQAGKAFKGISSSIIRTERSVARSAGRITSSIFSIQGALVSLGAGLVVRNMLQVTDSFDQFQVALETLEGSLEAGTAKWKELMYFAEITPFSIGEVMQSYKMMKAYGLDPTVEAMEALGDTAAVVGRDKLPLISYALGQIASSDKVIVQDLRQLMAAGIGVNQAFKESFNIGVNEIDKLNAAIAQGAITTKTVYEGLVDYMRNQFGGQMQKLNKTLGGQWEELKSKWEIFADELMEGGLKQYIVDFLSTINDLIDDLRSNGDLVQWAKDMSSGMVKAFDFAIRAIVQTFGLVREAIDGLKTFYYGFMREAKGWAERQIQDQIETLEEQIALLKKPYDELSRWEKIKISFLDADNLEDMEMELAGLQGQLKDIQQDAVDYADKYNQQLIDTDKHQEQIRSTLSAIEKITTNIAEDGKDIKMAFEEAAEPFIQLNEKALQFKDVFSDINILVGKMPKDFSYEGMPNKIKFDASTFAGGKATKEAKYELEDYLKLVEKATQATLPDYAQKVYDVTKKYTDQAEELLKLGKMFGKLAEAQKLANSLYAKMQEEIQELNDKAIKNFNDLVEQSAAKLLPKLDQEILAIIKTQEAFRDSLIEAYADLEAAGKATPEMYEALDQALKNSYIGQAQLIDELKNKHNETADVVKEAWTQAYRSIQTALADMIYNMKFSLSSLGDIFKRFFANIASAKIMGSMSGFIPGMSGTGGSAGSGGGLGGIFSSLTKGLGSFFSAPSDLLGDLAFEMNNETLARLGDWLSDGIGSVVGAGLMSALTSLVMTGDPAKSIMSGLGSAGGFALGGPIGAALGGIAGNLLGSLFGGKTPDDVDLHILFGDPNKSRDDFDTFLGNWHKEFLESDRSIGEILAVNIRKGDFMSDAEASQAEQAIVDYFQGIFNAIDSQMGISVADAIAGQGLGIHYNDFQKQMKDGDIQGALANLTEQFFKAFTDELVNAALSSDMASLVTFEKLQGWQAEGENIADTFIRIVGALNSVPDIMDDIDNAIGILNGTVSATEAGIKTFKDSLKEVDTQIDTLKKALLSMTDPSEYVSATQQLSALIIQRYELEKNKIAEIQSKIIDLRIEELNWLINIQGKIDALVGSNLATGMNLTGAQEMVGNYYAATTTADKLKYLNQAISYYDAYVNATIADMQASAQAQASALESQKSQITANYQARMDALRDEYDALIDIARQWERVADNVQRLLDDLIYSSKSPADVFERLDRMQQEMAGLDLTSPEGALRYTDLAGDYASLLGEAYGNVSNPEYMAAYNEMVTQLDALGELAGSQKSSEELQAELNAKIDSLQASLDIELSSIDSQIASLNSDVNAEIQAFKDAAAENFEWAKNEGMALYDQMIQEQTDALAQIIGDKTAEEYLADLQFAAVNELIMVRSNLENIVEILGGTPKYGEGGYVDKPHLAFVGDEPEYIIPQKDLSKFYENNFPARFAPTQSKGDVHLHMTTNINTQGQVDEKALVRAQEDYLHWSIRRGRLGKAIEEKMRYGG